MEEVTTKKPMATFFEHSGFMRSFGDDKMAQHLDKCLFQDLKENISCAINPQLFDGRSWSVKISVRREPETEQTRMVMRAELFLIDPNEAEVGDWLLGTSITYKGNVFRSPDPIKNGTFLEDGKIPPVEPRRQDFEFREFIRKGKYWQRTM